MDAEGERGEEGGSTRHKSAGTGRSSGGGGSHGGGWGEGLAAVGAPALRAMFRWGEAAAKGAAAAEREAGQAGRGTEDSGKGNDSVTGGQGGDWRH